MIRWVDNLLYRWGLWVNGQSGAVGYPSTSPMFRDTPGGGVPGSREPVGVTMNNYRDIDALVAGLPGVLRVVVEMHYQVTGSKRETAKRCGISDKSVSQYLGTAHKILERELNARRERDELQTA